MFARMKARRAARKAYRQALSVFENERFEQAVDLLLEHEDGTAKDSMACQLLGRALFETGNKENAESWLEKAAGLAPHNPANHLFLAYARLAMDDLDGTERALEQAEEADPENPMGFYLQGLCLLRRSRIKEAEQRFEKFVGFEKSTVFTRLLAMAELYLRNEAESVEAADKLIEKMEKELDEPANRPALPMRMFEYMAGQRIGYPDVVLARLLAMTEHYFHQVEKKSEGFANTDEE